MKHIRIFRSSYTLLLIVVVTSLLFTLPTLAQEFGGVKYTTNSNKESSLAYRCTEYPEDTWATAVHKAQVYASEAGQARTHGLFEGQNVLVLQYCTIKGFFGDRIQIKTTRGITGWVNADDLNVDED